MGRTPLYSVLFQKDKNHKSCPKIIWEKNWDRGMEQYENKVELWHNIIQHKKHASYLPDYVRVQKIS